VAEGRMREVRRKAQLAARRSLVVLLARSEAIRTNRRCKEGLVWFRPMLRLPRFTVGQAARVDYETANIQHDLIAAVYRQLRERGPGAQAAGDRRVSARFPLAPGRGTLGVCGRRRARAHGGQT